MANPSAAHEPSMEEILASIRQIISEDGGGSEPADAKAEESREPISAEEETEHEAEAFAAEVAEEEPEPEPESASVQGESMTPQSFGSAAAAEPRQPYAAPAAPARPQAPASDNSGPLLSAQSGNAVHGAFSALAHTILAQNARTLEDLVAEMLQPMLRSWLDDNLPALVERLVQDEIQRVSRGKR